MARSRSRALQKLGQGTFGAGGEKLTWTYYDTAILAVAVQVQRLFVIPIGGGAPAKTLDDTNMTTAGQMPQAQNLRVHAVKVMYTSSAAKATADVQSLYSMFKFSTMEIQIPGKDSLLTLTLQEVLGAATQFALTPTVAGDNIPLNSPRYHGIFPLTTPITLAALTPFEVRVTHHVAVAAALANDLLTIGLAGTLLRGN